MRVADRGHARARDGVLRGTEAVGRVEEIAHVDRDLAAEEAVKVARHARVLSSHERRARAQVQLLRADHRVDDARFAVLGADDIHVVRTASPSFST